jgi:hypothetical protein
MNTRQTELMIPVLIASRLQNETRTRHDHRYRSVARNVPGTSLLSSYLISRQISLLYVCLNHTFTISLVAIAEIDVL